MDEKKIKSEVKKRYSKIAKEGSSCCPTCRKSISKTAESIGYSEDELQKLPKEAFLGLGCGNPTALADLNEGETVLDLGSGAGVDVFLAAEKVGKSGRVIGVDMTEEMIRKGEKLAKEYGYKNVEFRHGEIENLPVEDNSVDVIISNCVINLSPDKLKTFKEAHRVLKSGGRMMVSDIVTEGELPEDIKKSSAAWSECVAGALEKNRYLDIIKKAGFRNVEIVGQNKYPQEWLDERLAGKILSIQVLAKK